MSIASPRRVSPWLALSMWMACAVHADAAALLHPMFQDHAVVQRDQPIPVYGFAASGEQVTVEFAGAIARARADAEGRWQATLPALTAGGPHALVASTQGGDVQRADDVMVGDVWLCAGQSNMVLQVHRTLDSRAEIADAKNDAIRMLTVGEHGSAMPLATFASPVRWLTSSPQTTPEFSAACYYFARELQKTVSVPMGLVTAASGGSRIQAWISAKELRSLRDYDVDLDILEEYVRAPAAASTAWGERWASWWHSLSGVGPADEPWNPDPALDAQWQSAPVSLGAWERWGVPELAEFNGMLWYRTTVRLDARQAGMDAVLAIGAADEIDTTWVNGRSVGSRYGADVSREYALPRGLLRAGENVVVVNVLDTYKDGGLIGPAARQSISFDDGTRVALDREWRYRQVPSQAGAPPPAPWNTASGLSTLYNGMIAPIGRYGLRGFVWYQGESNTGEAARYGRAQKALLANWRRRFGADLPWLGVQLANYGAEPTRPGESGWADLREVQRRNSLADPHSGLAIAIDIGDRYDIHPPNKQEVGRRLALAARHVVYGETDVPPSGPVAVSARREGDTAVVVFEDIRKGLVAYGADGPIGFELCGAAAGTCRYASARIQGPDVVLRASLDVPMTRVRYGWADNPVVTLFDGVGLPAGPFEIPVASATER